MLPTKISFVAFLVAITACLLSCSVEAHAFLTLRTSNPIQSRAFFSVRGGASVDVDDIESSDYDEEEEEEEDEDPKLAKSTQAAISKASKKAVSSTLASTKPAKTKKKSSSLLKLLKFPYIVGACLNPFVFTKMIKGYWVSLFNLEYLKENVDTSENLRTALQEKAKKGGGSPNRGKRKMRPGQAKTLSDLPQLNT